MLMNAIILLVAYILTVCWFKLSIKNGRVKGLSLTTVLMKKILVRAFLLYLFIGVICWYFHLDALKLLVIVIVVSLYCLIAGLGLLSSGFLAVVPMVIYYLLFQWILGFPDKERLMPSNEIYENPVSKPIHLIGQIGQTETALRPVGEIIIEGKKYAATSDFDYIEKGQQVIVTAIKDLNLIVSSKKS